MACRCGFGEANVRKYGWVIIGDSRGDDTAPPGSCKNAVGVSGPRGTPFTQDFILKNGEHFRMLDDDGIIYYYGKIVGNYLGLEPLDDFGAPNAGCTTIQYLKNGVWETA